MPRITGQFTITHNGNQITFTLVGETYKSVDTESGVKSRKVIKWQATEHDAELGEITRFVFVLPRTNRANVVEEYFSPVSGHHLLSKTYRHKIGAPDRREADRGFFVKVWQGMIQSKKV